MHRWAEKRGHRRQARQFLTGSGHDPHIRCRGPAEPVMDILRHVSEVEVSTPEALRAKVAEGCGGFWGNLASDRMGWCGCRMF